MSKVQQRSAIPLRSAKVSSKVKAVPDFSKLHNQWNNKLQRGKACIKKPCTVVQEFGLSHPQPGHVLGTKSGESTPKAHISRSAKRKATSPLNEPTAHDENCFHADPQALQSILENRGVLFKEVSKPQPANHRQTFATPSLRTPLSSILKNKTNTDGRMSMYGRVPRDASKATTEKQNPVHSRLTLQPQNTKSPASFVVNDELNGRMSMYGRVLRENSKAPTLQNTKSPASVVGILDLPTRYSMIQSTKNAGTPTGQVTASARKALGPPSRVLRDSVKKSPAVRVLPKSAQKQCRWADVLSEESESTDSVKKMINFEDEADENSENNAKLQNLQSKEHKLEKEIEKMEIQKRERKRQRTENHQGSGSTPVLTRQVAAPPKTPVVLDKKQLECIAREEAELKAELARLEREKAARDQARIAQNNISQAPNPAPSRPRIPFAALSKDEIVVRSLPGSGSDSETETDSVTKPVKPAADICGSSHKTLPLSPLAKDSHCTRLSPYLVAHGASSRVRPTKEKTPNGGKIRNFSPRTIRSRDMWSPSPNRLNKSTPKSKSKQSREGVKNSHWAKENSPLVHKPSQKIINNVCNMSFEEDYDKENSTPPYMKPMSPKVQVFNKMESNEDEFNESVEKLNQSLADITFQYEELENEANVLNEMSFQEDPSGEGTENILTQLQMIKKQQEDLLHMEKLLQRQLFKQKYGSPKSRDSIKPKSAKKRLQMVQEDDQKDSEKLVKSMTPENSKPEEGDMEVVSSEVGKCMEADETTEFQPDGVSTPKALGEEMESKISDSQTNVSPLATELQPETELLQPESQFLQRESGILQPVQSAFTKAIPNHKIVSPEAIKPEPRPSLILDPTTLGAFSPKPMMVGSAQIYQPNAVIEPPIQTPLALRTAAVKIQEGIAFQRLNLSLQNSPIDLSSKNNSKTNSANTSAFSPDVSFGNSDNVYENLARDLALRAVTQTPPPPLPPRQCYSAQQTYQNLGSLMKPPPPTPPMELASNKPEQSSLSNVPAHLVSRSAPFLNFLKEKPVAQSPLKTSTKLTTTVTTSRPQCNLSLMANLALDCKAVSSPSAKSCAVSALADRYQGALLDDEVSLFMYRLANRGQQVSEQRDSECKNPVAKMLEHGDDMHFVPIRHEAVDCLSSPDPASAFLAYRCV